MKQAYSWFKYILLLTILILASCDTGRPGKGSSSDSAERQSQSPPLVQDLSDLQKIVTHVKDINEIKRLQRSYGYYIDRSEWDEVVDLLTDDATAEYGHSGIYEGKEHIRAMLYAIGYGKHGLRPQQLREHIQLQPVITLSDDGMTAKGRWRAFVLLGQYGEYARWQLGPYENEYRKENGRWKISKMHWLETFTVPFKGGWTTKMEATNVADRDFQAADHPTSFEYQGWPGVSNLPYHYSHPVTGAPLPVTSSSVEPAELTAQSSAELQTKVEELRHQIELAEDERDIEILQRTYGYYVDKNLWPQISELFSEQGTLEIGGRGVFVGKQRVLEYLNWLGHPAPGRLYDHTQMQGVVHVSPDHSHAKGRWRALVFAGVGGNTLLGDCIYENEYVREEGVWKISKLHAYFIMYTRWEQGWAVKALPNTQVEEELPPDRPPTVVHKTYPGELSAPYHYQNPITGAPVFESVAEPHVVSANLGMQALQQQIAELRVRAEKLSDHQLVERLQNAFGYYFDQRDWDAVADTFTNDATMERGQRGVYKGKGSIRNSLPLYGEKGKPYGNVFENMYYQPVIHINGDGQSAKARFRTLNFAGDYEGEATIGAGVFENTYVKQDGVWKIQSDHLYTTFTADYTKGWSKGAIPVAGMSDTLPPDAPPTFEYQAFPYFYEIPFHYPNPVTGENPLN